jgi:hypothetical protein
MLLLRACAEALSGAARVTSQAMVRSTMGGAGGMLDRDRMALGEAVVDEFGVVTGNGQELVVAGGVASHGVDARPARRRAPPARPLSIFQVVRASPGSGAVGAGAGSVDSGGG